MSHERHVCIRKGCADNQYRSAWGVTAVDGLTTAIVMEHGEIVNQILEYIPKIDFTTTATANEDISLFETNIRYLGGLISGMRCSLV